MAGRNDQPPGGNPDYEVGYGRPPKKHQFKPGDLNNPLGRKKKAKMTDINIHDSFWGPVKVTLPNGRKTEKPFLHVWLESQKMRALKGDRHADKIIKDIINEFHLFNTRSPDAPQQRFIIELVDPDAERERIREREAAQVLAQKKPEDLS